MAPRRSQLVAAYAAVYLIWGSTYLAILWAIEALPPLLMAGTRFVVSGALMWAIIPGRGLPRPTARDWGWAAILGSLMLLMGNGGVTLAETRLPTGITALLVCFVPLWMAVLDAARPGGTRLTALVGAGLALGLVGVGVLAGAGRGWSGAALAPMLLVLVGSLGWAAGSLLSRGQRIQQPLLRAVALQMLAGGAIMCLAGLLRGEAGAVDPGAWTGKAVAAWAYLVLFGSVAAFSCYAWLLRVQPASVVGTYAFVNPVVAVLLGAWLLDEPLTRSTLAGAALIVAAVVLITWSKVRQDRARAAPPARPL